MSASNASFWITLVQLVFVPIQILGLYLCSKQFMRHYLAAQAMNGLLAQSCGSAFGTDPVFGAQYAYAMADEMLKAGKA
jgi:hypothetical protein